MTYSLFQSYLRHLTTRSVENEAYGIDDEDEQDEMETEIEKGRDEDISSKNIFSFYIVEFQVVFLFKNFFFLNIL